MNSSIMRQKSESQNGYKKPKHFKFFEKTNISYPWYMQVYKTPMHIL